MGEQGFVMNSTGRLRKVLLCPPTHFRFQPVNEITRGVLANGGVPDLEVLAREHQDFVEAYRSAGVEVEPTDPVPGLSYMVHASDFGLPCGGSPHRQLQGARASG